MSYPVLIVPGVHGPQSGHWLEWLQAVLPEAYWLEHDAWDAPVLAHWAGRVKQAIRKSSSPVWLVAQGFGCLAAVMAAVDQADCVAGALLVAPVDPEDYSAEGLLPDHDGIAPRHPSISDLLPRTPLPFTTQLVAHAEDASMRLVTASQWAERWGSRLVLSSSLGGVDPDTHRGPWPQAQRLLLLMQRAQSDLPLGTVPDHDGPAPRRHGWLAKLRRQSRATL